LYINIYLAWHSFLNICIDMMIKSLNNINFDAIYKAFNQAFADYEVQLDSVQLQAMLKRRGFNPELSFAAFEGNEIIAFTLNGIGNFNGIMTAYDTGTATLKEYRGKGLATNIFEFSIPYLKEKKIKQYLLEVLQHNTKAVSVYKNLGFEITREFNYYKQKNNEIFNLIVPTEYNCIIKEIDIDKYTSISDFWDFTPSWQNSFESIERASESFISLGAFVEDKLVGYCILEPASGDLTQIAVNKEYRRKGIATLLLKEVVKLNKNDTLKVVNTDILCSSISDFLKANNIDIKGKQFEMIKVL